VRFLIALDSRLMYFCTKVAHAFQRLTGRTNFFIAKIGITMGAVAFTIGVTNYFRQVLPHKGYLVSVIIGLIALVVMTFDMMALDRADEQSQPSTERVMIPGITGRSRLWMRLAWFYFVCSDTIVLITAFVSLGVTLPWILEIAHSAGLSYGLFIFYYFIAVEPLKPQKGKIREWIESLSSSPALAPAESRN
jgi:hypothetical protein